MKKIRIQQDADSLKDVNGIDVQLTEGEPVHIEDVKISQNAQTMQNVTGLKVTATGSQSASLSGVHIMQPGAEIRISDDPNVKVEINKQN